MSGNKFLTVYITYKTHLDGVVCVLRFHSGDKESSSSFVGKKTKQTKLSARSKCT